MTSTVEFDERSRDRTEARREEFMDEAETKRPVLVETWIQESPLLYEVIGDELLHDVEFINAIRKICYSYNPSQGRFAHRDDMAMAGARTIARLVRQQVDRTQGEDLVEAECRRAEEGP